MAKAMEGKEVENFPEPVYVDGQDPETGHEEELIAPPAPPPEEDDGEECDPVSEFFGTCDGEGDGEGGWGGGGNPWEGRP